MMLLRLTTILYALCLFAVAPAFSAPGVPQDRAQIYLSFAPVVKNASPAIVNIYTKKRVRQGRRVPLMFEDPFFQGFFGGMFRGVPRERVERSLGSGVIVRKNGIVVTNNHVIEGADEITISLSDKREFRAEIVGADARTDLAVLRIVDEEDLSLPFLEIGNSDALETGDLVLAIGNPFGVGQTVTSGIVSALARTGVGIGDFQFFIQTDAAINPGNSGGALLSLDGKLAGINTVILSAGGGSNGIGFAIPANMVRTVLFSMLESGSIVRPWLGMSTQEMTQDMADSLGLDTPQGVLVSRLAKTGPAAKAGIMEGDVLLTLSGKPILDPEYLRYRTLTTPIETVVPVRLWRSGKERSVSLKLLPPPEEPPRNETRISAQSPLIGVTVANTNPALAEEMGWHPEAKGVVVLDVADRRMAGLFRGGDVIETVNGKPIDRVSDLLSVLKARTSIWRIKIRRGNRVMVVKVQG